jgi:hypothetical protein
MPDETQRIPELISAPMEAVIAALGVGIARAQRELDRFAIETQREIDEDPLLSEQGLRATFYQFPRAELELTTAIALEEKSPTERQPVSPGVAPRVLQTQRLRRIHLQPVNAVYQNQFGYNVQASSRLRLTIVPVPPATAETVIAPRLSRDQVLEIAQPALVTEPDGRTLPRDARLAVNFNGAARLWFILQYQIVQNDVRRLALVVIDDETSRIVKQEK